MSGVVASAETLGVVREACEGLATAPWFLMLDAAQAKCTLARSRRACAVRADAADVSGDDTVLIVYTSGTTGFPKGAMHSQSSFITGGEAFVQRVYLQPDDRVMVVLPLFHINALFYSVAGTLAAGCSMIVVPRFSASTFWQTAVDYGATEVNIIEAIGTILKNRPRSEFRPDHTLRAIYGVRHSMEATFRDDFKIPHLIGGYGMTEIPGVTCNPVEGVRKPGSMGRSAAIPIPRGRGRSAASSTTTGRTSRVGEEGELLVKTPILMQGYFRDPEQTKEAFADGWFKTGDLVKRDEDGYFFFVSRKKDIIRRRGENIAGAELDRVIGMHPGGARGRGDPGAGGARRRRDPRRSSC